MMKQAGTCRCCQTPYRSRSGRGLCRRCWDNPKIREKYPKQAEFGSSAARNLQWERCLIRKARIEAIVEAGEWVI